MGVRYQPGSFVFCIFIYLFLAALGPHCWAGFSRCGQGVLLFSCGSHRSGFSCCGARPLGHAGFGSCGVWAQRLQLPGPRAQAQLLHGTWDLPGSGIEHTSPASSLPLSHQGSPSKSSFEALPPRFLRPGLE